MNELLEQLIRIYNSSRFFSHTIVPLLIILAGYPVSILISKIFLSISRYFTAKTKTTLDDKIFAAFHPPIKWLIFIAICYFALSSVPGDYEAVSFVQSALVAIIIIILTVILARIFKTTIAWFIESRASKLDARIGKEFMPVIEKSGIVILYIIGLIWVLDSFGVNVSGLIVSLGVGGVAVGFAAKDALANIIAGFVLMIDRPFRVGDRIELENGKIGDVVQLGLRSTHVKTFDETILILPNQELLQKEIVNHSYPTRRIKRNIFVQVAYGTDLEKAKKIIMKLCGDDDLILKGPGPFIWVYEFADSGIKLMVNIWVEDLQDGWVAQCRLTQKIYEEFGKKGIEIPYPSRSIYIKENGKKGKGVKTR